ncbi:stage V sporulation protein S [Deinococcus lacus]|uniref:Stage V sporulation protein S n=1 Tax=Deinococcus lacus TaxID=392561 RepID=A0ABW1YCD1_9DEIO
MQVLETVKVSGQSKPSAVAGAIAGLLRSQPQIEVQAIGAEAVNQSVKALAIARDYLADNRRDLIVQPSFVKLPQADGERTAIQFIVTAIARV